MAVSVRDVAAAASVSVGTVSNVLNRPSKVSPATVERVLQAIEELGFVRNDAARQLRAGPESQHRTRRARRRQPVLRRGRRGAEDRAAEDGHVGARSATATRPPERESAYLELFREQRVNGVLVTPATDDLALARAPARRRGAGRSSSTARCRGSDFGSVAVDDVEGGHLAVSHLTTIGRRRIAYRERSARDPAGRRPARGRAPCRRGVSGRDARGDRDGRADRCCTGAPPARQIVARAPRRPARRGLRRERPARRRRAAGVRHDGRRARARRHRADRLRRHRLRRRRRSCRSARSVSPRT